MDTRSAVVNLAWVSVNAPGYVRFARALGDLQRTQESLLRDYLGRNRNTVFGRRHRHASVLLGISTAAFLWESVAAGSALLALTGSVALGGITAEMLLGNQTK